NALVDDEPRGLLRFFGPVLDDSRSLGSCTDRACIPKVPGASGNAATLLPSMIDWMRVSVLVLAWSRGEVAPARRAGAIRSKRHSVRGSRLDLVGFDRATSRA